MSSPDPVAIVTGSNRGIGEVVARLLQRHGWKVVSNGRSASARPGTIHVQADVSTPAGARKLVGAARKAFGRLDLLVSMVGDFAYTPVSDFQIDQWERIFRSNLQSAWYPCKEALPLLRKTRGQIITIGGPVTQTVRGNPRAVAYQMAKTALTATRRASRFMPRPSPVAFHLERPRSPREPGP